MHKSILLAAAVAALGAAGGALAQQECGTANTPQCELVRPNWTGTTYYNPHYEGIHVVPQLPFAIADGRYFDGRYYVPHTFVTPYAPTRRDRDGDGIRNSRDRYPDDPRYR